MSDELDHADRLKYHLTELANWKILEKEFEVMVEDTSKMSLLKRLRHRWRLPEHATFSQVMDFMKDEKTSEFCMSVPNTVECRKAFLEVIKASIEFHEKKAEVYRWKITEKAVI